MSRELGEGGRERPGGASSWHEEWWRELMVETHAWIWVQTRPGASSCLAGTRVQDGVGYLAVAMLSQAGHSVIITRKVQKEVRQVQGSTSLT